MADWMSMAVSWEESPLAPATIKIGAILDTNMARMCCSPKGTACFMDNTTAQMNVVFAQLAFDVCKVPFHPDVAEVKQG